LVPQALLWAGPLVTATTKQDLLQLTGNRRLAIARPEGGSVYLYAPTLTEPLAGLQPARWSPLQGCADPTLCKTRVDALLKSSGAGKGVTDGPYWVTNAGLLLRGYFHAAALSDQDMKVVLGWLADQDLEDPAHLIGRSASPASRQWAHDLLGMRKVTERTRGIFFSQARVALEAFDLPAVLENSLNPDFHIDQFLRTASTLYVVSPTRHQELVAPLISALIEAIKDRAYELWQRDELQGGRLLLQLDELANIAPLPSLESIVTQGADQGVLVSLAVQSIVQLTGRYGQETAESVISSARAKVIFGGLGESEQLDRLAKLLGERELRRQSHSRDGQGHITEHTSSVREPRVSAGELRAIQPGRALLIYHTYRPELVQIKDGPSAAPFRAMVGWDPPRGLNASFPGAALVAG
jgi:type IV secretory pathway TraG/TraD family ATPase VirD4